MSIQTEGEKYRVLVLDDDPEVTETIMVYLEEENIRLRVTQDPEKALRLVREFEPHIVLTDLKMPGTTGIEILKETKRINPEIEVVLMTAHASAQTAVEAMKEGAYDYLIKPFKMIELKSILSRIMETRDLILQNRELRQQLSALSGSGMIFGSSPAMNRIRKLVSMIADNDASILITGESGTGKSMLARAIHELGGRQERPFVTIECAAIPSELLESELFGYERGAFTGADRRKKGRLERANGGTLFLDEIGDMPLELQVKMLRVLQEREFSRVGGSETISIDVRIITATNRDLQKMIKTGGFREDLFYRLNVVPVHLPPLRERREDLPDILSALTERISARHNRPNVTLTGQALRQAQNYTWPGNIRELENIIERTLVFNREDTIEELMLPDDRDSPGRRCDQEGPINDLIRNRWETALDRAGGDRVKAAECLGIPIEMLEKILVL